MTETITRQQLSEMNGAGGKPVYVAFRGKVYDVSDSALWMDGDHMGEHVAGRDLTDEMDGAPHDESVLDDMPVVGTLAD